MLVETACEVKDAVKYLRKFSALGFDTETKPSFRKGDNHRVALLQLATEERVVLFRIHRVGLPEGILKILSDPSIIKAGVAIHDDLKALQRISNFTPASFVELQERARSRGISDFSLKKLTAIVLGFRISKIQQLSNWEANLLTEQQLAYAATDAWTSLQIYKKLV